MRQRFLPIGFVSPVLVLWCLLVALPAQTTRELTGYDDLVAELGGAPSDLAETVYIGPADSAWTYRKGTSEASNPGSAWRQPGFTEDATWISGQTPVGYGDGDDNTTLNDMQGSYTTIYLRRMFTIPKGAAVPQRLLLRIYVDDGAVVWINGLEVARFHVRSRFSSFQQHRAGS